MHQSKCFSSYLGFLIARWQCMRIHAAIFRYKTAISVLPMRYGALSLTYFETPQTSKAFQFAPILFVLQNPRKFNPITPIRFPPFMFTWANSISFVFWIPKLSIAFPALRALQRYNPIPVVLTLTFVGIEVGPAEVYYPKRLKAPAVV